MRTKKQIFLYSLEGLLEKVLNLFNINCETVIDGEITLNLTFDLVTQNKGNRFRAGIHCLKFEGLGSKVFKLLTEKNIQSLSHGDLDL